MERIGSYEIQETVQRNVGSVVVRAKHARLDRTVILRCATAAAPSHMKEALVLEASLLDAIHHPNVVPCLDFFEAAGRPVVVLADIAGLTLARALEATPRLSIAGACEIGRSLAAALSAVHEIGAAHGDVKPANLVIGNEGTLVLIDFGSARRVASDRRGIHEDGGTAAYMAPERMLGELLPASDVFSLGVCLYELLTGKKPFDASVQRARGGDPLVPLSRLRPEVPSWMDELVSRCLSRAALDRPSTRSLEEAFAAHIDAGRRKDAIKEVLVAAHLLEQKGQAVVVLPSDPLERRERLIYAIGATLFAALSLIAFVVLFRGSSHKMAGIGFLRVVATPWAEVTVDGVHVDTTPFARALELQVGTHYVLFEHPYANPERREVAIRAGVTEFLDVAMTLRAPPETAVPRASASITSLPVPLGSNGVLP